MSATILLPADSSSSLLVGTVGFETDWGGGYRVAALTTGTLFGGAVAGPRALEFRFGPLVRERAALSLAVGVTINVLPPAEGSSRGYAARTDPRDRHSREVGHELVTQGDLGTRVHARYVSARTRL